MLILFPNQCSDLRYEHVSFRQAKFAPSEAILSPEYHWETPRINMYGTVVKTDHGYEMFYQCGNAVRIGLATSSDGYNWTKPMINATDFKAKAHDIILNQYAQEIASGQYSQDYELSNLVAGYHMPSVVYEPHAEKPYKIFAFGEEGYRVLYSENGRQFTEYPNNPVIPFKTYQNPHTKKYWGSDVAPCFVDQGVYKAMVKTYELDDQGRTRRCVGYAESQNFEQWTTPETVWVPSEKEDEVARQRGFEWADFYGLCPFNYGDSYLGYLWLFEIQHEFPSGTNFGKIEVFLAHSPDGKKWHRLSDEPFIPWDLNFGEEGGMVTTASAPIFEEQAIKVYYSDSNYEHGFHEKDFTKQIEEPIWVARCAELPKERLVGAFAEQGSVFLTLDASRYQCLRLNIDTTEGELHLQCLSLATSEPLMEQSVLIRALDETDYHIQLSELIPFETAQLIILRLELTNSVLYAIELT